MHQHRGIPGEVGVRPFDGEVVDHHRRSECNPLKRQHPRHAAILEAQPVTEGQVLRPHPAAPFNVEGVVGGGFEYRGVGVSIQLLVIIIRGMVGGVKGGFARRLNSQGDAEQLVGGVAGESSDLEETLLAGFGVLAEDGVAEGEGFDGLLALIGLDGGAGGEGVVTDVADPAAETAIEPAAEGVALAAAGEGRPQVIAAPGGGGGVAQHFAGSDLKIADSR